MTPAEELTVAADRLDKLIAEATSGPWRVTGRANVDAPSGWVVASVAGRKLWPSDADAAYIAAMNPDVGRALAALLRSCAAYHGARETRSWLGTDYGLEQLVRAILAPKETS